MFRVTFKFKEAIIDYDEATDYGDFWSLRFFDVWHNIEKKFIKSVEKL